MDRVHLFAIALALGVATAAVGWWWLRRRSREAVEEVPPRPPAVPAPRASPGQRRLGRYVVEREIGRGASGVVYLGRDPDNDQPVAIKTLLLRRDADGEPGDAARERFLREAQAAQRLQHPDIVAVLDAGEQGELGWIAMEYVRGRDLTRYTEPRRLLPPPLALALGARIARALAHAHSRGVVHRDVKPANVIVDLPADTVKVADFGVAHLVDAERSRSGQVFGTPSYMAPEQLAGRLVDGRADLYALGVVLFQLFSGRLPHEADSIGALLAAIANERAPDLRSVRPELPESLADVVALALEKRPEVRYADGEQLAADLDAVAAQLERDAAPDVTSSHSRPGGSADD